MSPLVWKAVGVSVYLLVLLYIGVLAARRMNDVRDYYAGVLHTHCR